MNEISGRLVSIGAGNMAEALLQGALRRGVLQPGQVRLTDVNAERLAALSGALGVEGMADNRAAVADATVVLLAVKPQVLDPVLADLAPSLPAGALVISIAAGVPAARMEALLAEGQRVVRVMPNTPSLIGEGAAAVAPGQWATAEDLDVAERLLGAVGLVVRVDETDLDAVTAISGSGPAYVFYLIEALQEAAERVGLTPELARLLIAQTMKGATALWDESGEDAGRLRERVTSKGGTTEAALNRLDASDVGAVWVEAVEAAFRRSRELSAPAPGAE